MKVDFAKQETKDTFYTLLHLNWLLRIFNLSCIHRKERQLKATWSLTKNIIYISVFGLINFSLLIYRIESLEMIHHNSTFITFSESTQVSYLIGYLEYIVDLCFIYKYGREMLLKLFKNFDYIDQILGMTYYDEIRNIISKTVGFAVIMFVFSSIFDYSSWIVGYGMVPPTLYALDYLYFFLNMLSILDGMSYVVQLEYRLKMMRDLLQSYFNSPNATKTITHDDSAWASRTGTHCSRLEALKTLCHGRFIEVIGFNRCYLLLLEQTNYLNTMFGARVVAFCTNLLINMINLLNMSIRIAIGSMRMPYSTSRLPSVTSLIRFLSWGFVGILIVYRCEQTYRQTQKILSIIDLVLVNKHNSDSLKTTLVDLRNLLLTRPIKFHAINFFTVEYTLLVSLTSVVVTYTIILLQNVK